MNLVNRQPAVAVGFYFGRLKGSDELDACEFLPLEERDSNAHDVGCTAVAACHDVVGCELLEVWRKGDIVHKVYCSIGRKMTERRIAFRDTPARETLTPALSREGGRGSRLGIVVAEVC